MEVKKILISQPRPSERSPYFEIAKAHEVDLVFRQLIKTEGLTSKEYRQFKVNPADYTAVIFSTRTAIDNYFRLCKELRFTVPDTMKYFCTSETLALYLQKYIVYRKRKIFFGETGRITDASLVQAINKHNKEKYLMPVSEETPEAERTIPGVKVKITAVVMYRVVSNDFEEGHVFDYDMVIFFSPNGVPALLKNVPDLKEKYPDLVVACFGAGTAKAATDAGLTVTLQVPSPEYSSMTAALDAFLSK